MCSTTWPAECRTPTFCGNFPFLRKKTFVRVSLMLLIASANWKSRAREASLRRNLSPRLVGRQPVAHVHQCGLGGTENQLTLCSHCENLTYAHHQARGTRAVLGRAPG